MNQQYQPGKIQQFSNVLPVGKFIFLYVISFGIYAIPWSHRYWKYFKEREGLEGSAWLRSVFWGVTLYWLVKRIVALAERRGYPEKPSPFLIAFLFYFITGFGRLPDPIWLIGLFSFLPLLTVVRAGNFYWEQEQPNLPIRRSWTGGEIAWTVFGVVFWLLVLIGLSMPIEA